MVINVLLSSVRQYYIDEVRQSMRDRIQLNYGIDLNESDYNVHITRNWNTMQEWVSVAHLLGHFYTLTSAYQFTLF